MLIGRKLFVYQRLMDVLCAFCFMYSCRRGHDVGNQMTLVRVTSFTQMYHVSCPADTISTAVTCFNVIGGFNPFTSTRQFSVRFPAYLFKKSRLVSNHLIMTLPNQLEGDEAG